jgi:hypothetical protein
MAIRTRKRLHTKHLIKMIALAGFQASQKEALPRQGLRLHTNAIPPGDTIKGGGQQPDKFSILVSI